MPVEVRVTELPLQKVVGPPALTLGVPGNALTVIVVAVLAGEMHPLELAIVTV